jgi:magnesium transporter
MEVFLQLGNVRWYHEYGASKEMLGEIISRFDLHELVEEDLLETTTQDKIDVYDQCMFIVLHFPKYKPDRNKYLTNEFNIILGKDYIITLSKYKTNHIDKIKSMFEQEMERMEGE